MKARVPSTARLSFPLAAAIAALLAAPAAHAAALTWDLNSGDGAAITPGTGNWNTTGTNLVWNNAGANPNLAWTQTSSTSPLNSAIFGGADGTLESYVVTLVSQMAASALTFNNTGYNITGSTVDLQTSGSANGSITVAAGKTATINSALLGVNAGLGVSIGAGSTLKLGGGFNIAQYQFTGAGTLNITGGTSTGIQVPQFNNAIINQTGGTVNSTASNVSYIGHTAGRSVNYTISSGNMNVNGSTGGGLVVGRKMLSNTATLTVQSGATVNIGTTGFGVLEIAGVTNDTNAKLDVQGGTLTVGTFQATNQIIFFSDGAAAGKTSTMTQSNGTVTTNGIQFGNTATNAYDASSLATLQLSGGNLYVGTLGITRSANASILPVTIQLQGGTLGASGAWSSSLAMKLGTTGGGPTIRAQDSGTVARDITLTGILSNDGAVNGTLTKTGTGTLTLSNANTYSGATTVTAGTLALVGGSQASPITVNNLASLGFTLGSGTTSTSTVSFSSGSTVRITGTPAPATSYTLMTASSFLGITPVLDTPITGFQLYVEGGNTLKLVPVAGGYANWKATNAPTGNPGDDYDGDGVSNAVEYLLGGTKDTNDLSKLPAIDASGANLVFTFKRAQASIDGTTTVAIQVGTTFASWPDSYTVPDSALANNPGVTVQKDTPAGFDTVTLTVPRAPDGKKFARLVVTPAP